MNTVPPATASSLGTGADSLSGLAVLGKTALALALVIGLILLCSWLLRRLNTARLGRGQPLRIVGSQLLGPRERVVVVEVRDTWLVLGVTPTQISRLHELPAPAEDATPTPHAAQAPDAPAPPFATRLADALRQNLSGGRP
ncbi:flagellar biosynthetic protein FliO [Pseudomonas sp. NW5]|uniref:flagellar biosynthetic protein FliO n=1 Tax=Pseudomonas sp. NW5 TaxID=2934934 RepID=UPI0020210194|nr:flagellar biosynthetic protein FliO [Pseudomonas sp. NW5]MCL7462248.1 flagellar biosynthetic protein FliO [Pseudomonas sp. NW5]